MISLVNLKGNHPENPFESCAHFLFLAENIEGAENFKALLRRVSGVQVLKISGAYFGQHELLTDGSEVGVKNSGPVKPSHWSDPYLGDDEKSRLMDLTENPEFVEELDNVSSDLVREVLDQPDPDRKCANANKIANKDKPRTNLQDLSNNLIAGIICLALAQGGNFDGGFAQVQPGTTGLHLRSTVETETTQNIIVDNINVAEDEVLYAYVYNWEPSDGEHPMVRVSCGSFGVTEYSYCYMSSEYLNEISWTEYLKLYTVHP